MNYSKLKQIVVIAAAAGLLPWGAFDVRIQRSVLRGPGSRRGHSQGPGPG